MKKLMILLMEQCMRLSFAKRLTVKFVFFLINRNVDENKMSFYSLAHLDLRNKLMNVMIFSFFNLP